MGFPISFNWNNSKVTEKLGSFFGVVVQLYDHDFNYRHHLFWGYEIFAGMPSLPSLRSLISAAAYWTKVQRKHEATYISQYNMSPFYVLFHCCFFLCFLALFCYYFQEKGASGINYNYPLCMKVDHFSIKILQEGYVFRSILSIYIAFQNLTARLSPVSTKSYWKGIRQLKLTWSFSFLNSKTANESCIKLSLWVKLHLHINT